MQKMDKKAQLEYLEKLKKNISIKSLISQSLLNAVLIGPAFGLKEFWLDGGSVYRAVIVGISWSVMLIIISPAISNYARRAKISELERGKFDWKDYYQPIQPLLILILCIAIGLPLHVAIATWAFNNY
jgi:hypothetical protein